MQASFNLTILGSSAAVPTSDKFPTAQVLNAFGRLFLIDCGEGTQHQLRINRINFSKIDHILISHLHGDHFFGLIGLISSFSLLGRRNSLHIYAHSSIKEYIDFQLKFLDQNNLGYKIIYHPLNFKSPQVIFSNKKIQITSFPLKHSTACCGFRFDEKPKDANIIKEKINFYNIPIKEIKNIKAGADFVTECGNIIPNKILVSPPSEPRSFAFCSDTMHFPEIVPVIKNVSLLYHEATFMEKDKLYADRTKHSTAKDAAMLAKQAEVEKLIIGHFSARYAKTELLLNEAKSVFPETLEAKENTTYNI